MGLQVGQPLKEEEGRDKQLACCEPSCGWVSDSCSDGSGHGVSRLSPLRARRPRRLGWAPTSGPPASLVWGLERGRERDEDGATDWQPVGKRRRWCQGTAWRAKAPQEPENSFGEKRGAGMGVSILKLGGAEGIGERGGGGAVVPAPAAAWRGGGPPRTRRRAVWAPPGQKPQ